MLGAGLLLDLLQEGAAHAGQPVPVVAFDGDAGQVAVPLVGQAGHRLGGQLGRLLVALGLDLDGDDQGAGEGVGQLAAVEQAAQLGPGPVDEQPYHRPLGLGGAGQAGGGLVDLGGGQVEGVQPVAAQRPPARDRVVADRPGGQLQAEHALDLGLVVGGQVLEAEGVGGPGVPGVGGDPGEVVEVAEQDAVEPGVQGGQVDLQLVDVAVGVAAGQDGHGGVGDQQVQVVAGAGGGGRGDLVLEGGVVGALGHGVDPQPGQQVDRLVGAPVGEAQVGEGVGQDGVGRAGLAQPRGVVVAGDGQGGHAGRGQGAQPLGAFPERPVGGPGGVEQVAQDQHRVRVQAQGRLHRPVPGGGEVDLPLVEPVRVDGLVVGPPQVGVGDGD